MNNNHSITLICLLIILLAGCAPSETKIQNADTNTQSLTPALTLIPTKTFTQIPTSTNTPSNTPSATPIIPTNTPTIITYIVKGGDILLSIAIQFNVSQQSIIDMNPELVALVAQHQSMYIGMELKILLPPPIPSPTPTP